MACGAFRGRGEVGRIVPAIWRWNLRGRRPQSLEAKVRPSFAQIRMEGGHIRRVQYALSVERHFSHRLSICATDIEWL